jgi:hypothetical protein
MMRKINHLTVGWLEGSLKLLLDKDVALFGRFPVTLLTSVDSTTALSSSAIGQVIIERHPRCKFLGDGIVIPDSLIIDFVKSFDLFHGFDEAWLFEAEPSLPKPKEGWLVAPLNLNCNELTPTISSWMQETACKLGLGDGIGLNYVTSDEKSPAILNRSPSVISGPDLLFEFGRGL